MGACKNCEEVVSSVEIVEGLCKKCFSPRKVEERKKEEQIKKLEAEDEKKRPLSITIIASLMSIGAILLLLVMLPEFLQNGVNTLSLTLFSIAAIQLFFAFGLFKGVHHARTDYVVITVISTVVTLVMTPIIDGKYLANIFISLVFLEILYIPSSEAFFQKDKNI